MSDAVGTMARDASALPFVQDGRAPLVDDGAMGTHRRARPAARSDDRPPARAARSGRSSAPSAAPRPGHAVAWWVGLVVRGSLPAADRRGVGVADRGRHRRRRRSPRRSSRWPSCSSPPRSSARCTRRIGSTLGDRTATSLNDRLMAATLDPPGVAHLERADLTDDLTMARDFDLGITGPPLSYAMNFIADGFVGAVLRRRLGDRARLVRLVAGDRARARLVGDPLAAAGERDLARPPHAGGPARPAPRRVLVPPGRRPAGGQGGPPVRPRRLGDRALHARSAGASTTCSTRRPGCARGRCSAAWSIVARRQRAGVLDARRPRRRRPASTWRRRSSPSRPRSASARSPSAGSTGRSTAPPRRSPRCVRLESVMPPAGAAGHRRRVAAADRRRAAPSCASATSSFGYPGGPLVLDGFDLDDPGRHVAGHRRPERRRQDDAGQAAVPALRPDRRRASRSTASTCASSTSTRGAPA